MSEHIVTLEQLDSLVFDLVPWDRIFLRGDLGAGKTTFTQKLIQRFMRNPDLTVTSPTYTYYQKYGENLYHFDLYRITTPEDIMRIGADEILDDPHTICLIEWPEKLWDIYTPTKTVDISIINGGRRFVIENCQASKIDNL